jgi:hypothetical protein
MPLLTLTTPEVESRICLKDEEDNILFEDEVIYIDHLLSLSQGTVDMGDEEAVCRWLPVFTERLNRYYKIEIGETGAFYVAREASRLMWEIKKKYDSKLTFAESTESTPSS